MDMFESGPGAADNPPGVGLGPAGRPCRSATSPAGRLSGRGERMGISWTL